MSLSWLTVSITFWTGLAGSRKRMLKRLLPTDFVPGVLLTAVSHLLPSSMTKHIYHPSHSDSILTMSHIPRPNHQKYAANVGDSKGDDCTWYVVRHRASTKKQTILILEYRHVFVPIGDSNAQHFVLVTSTRYGF